MNYFLLSSRLLASLGYLSGSKSSHALLAPGVFCPAPGAAGLALGMSVAPPQPGGPARPALAGAGFGASEEAGAGLSADMDEPIESVEAEREPRELVCGCSGARPPAKDSAPLPPAAPESAEPEPKP